MDGQEEAGPAAEPVPVGREGAARDEAMDVRMMSECLAPCVQNGQEPDLAAEVPRVGGDGLERPGDGVEQDGIDHGLVVEGDPGDVGRHGEDDVEVRHRQQIGLTVGEPAVARRALALWTMPVAAGIIGDASMVAIFAGLDMTAEGGGPAQLDRGHDAALHATEMTGLGNAIGRAMAPENIRHLQSGTHRRAQPDGTPSRLRRSSGLCVLAIVLVATWV